MVTFVKRKMGDDILSVELTKKQIFGIFKELFAVLLLYAFPPKMIDAIVLQKNPTP